MVQTKHQKSKTKKQPQIKKHGKQTDISGFRSQLDALGLKIIQVTADGNCFFRALADQLEGNEEEHEKYRSMVVQYILKNRDTFEPFIEDEVPFDEYCQSMGKDGTWAGHMELQAASLVTHSNICIHRNMSPRWYIRNFNDKGVRMIHLSYHDGEHYNSVRLKEDPADGPARPIIIKADVNLTAVSHQAKAVVAQSKGRTSNNAIHSGSIKMVVAGSGCEDAEKVEEVLRQVDGDVDAAIEFLIAEQGAEETSVENGDVLCQMENHGNDWHDDEGEDSQQQNKLEDKTDKLKQFRNSQKASDDCTSCRDDKKIPRNKACPCGSKKKYKACCGAISGKTSSKILVDQAADTKGKRGKKLGKKGATVTAAISPGSDGTLPDAGALCI
ncbi:OVARIAN TUMOR DOMAIN-containing deubiquitinating enzyme 7, variant 2 [Ancistrocladus abbreviatus]